MKIGFIECCTGEEKAIGNYTHMNLYQQMFCKNRFWPGGKKLKTNQKRLFFEGTHLAM
jgi:hypothetical protein